LLFYFKQKNLVCVGSGVCAQVKHARMNAPQKVEKSQKQPFRPHPLCDIAHSPLDMEKLPSFFSILRRFAAHFSAVVAAGVFLSQPTNHMRKKREAAEETDMLYYVQNSWSSAE
jgi:hypothetical protein